MTAHPSAPASQHPLAHAVSSWCRTTASGAELDIIWRSANPKLFELLDQLAARRTPPGDIDLDELRDVIEAAERLRRSDVLSVCADDRRSLIRAAGAAALMRVSAHGGAELASADRAWQLDSRALHQILDDAAEAGQLDDTCDAIVASARHLEPGYTWGCAEDLIVDVAAHLERRHGPGGADPVFAAYDYGNVTALCAQLLRVTASPAHPAHARWLTDQPAHIDDLEFTAGFLYTVYELALQPDPRHCDPSGVNAAAILAAAGDLRVVSWARAARGRCEELDPHSWELRPHLDNVRRVLDVAALPAAEAVLDVISDGALRAAADGAVRHLDQLDIVAAELVAVAWVVRHVTTATTDHSAHRDRVARWYAGAGHEHQRKLVDTFCHLWNRGAVSAVCATIDDLLGGGAGERQLARDLLDVVGIPVNSDAVPAAPVSGPLQVPVRSLTRTSGRLDQLERVVEELVIVPLRTAPAGTWELLWSLASSWHGSLQELVDTVQLTVQSESAAS